MDFELNEAHLRKIADIFGDIGQVSLASIAIPFLFDGYEPKIAIIGFIFACVCWIWSVFLVGKASLL